jgi:RNA recognition motif-containing protein
MSTKIFVGRLADGTVSEDLLVLFRKFGTVTECAVMGGYAFVHMSSEAEAKAAIADLDGYSVKGSHIHVELSTASTQGRKKRSMDRDGGRFEPYPPSRHDNYPRAGGPPGPGPFPDRGDRYQPPPPQQPREEFASEQVKDLLELYFRDPYAFDQYAKTYYYGERAERERARVSYYDRRMPEAEYAAYAKSSNFASSASGVVEPSAYASSRALPPVGGSMPPGVRSGDDRYRAMNSYVGGRM